jgi:hypothetical protein
MGRLTNRVRNQRNSTRKNKHKGGGCGCGITGGKRKNKKSKTNKNKRKVKGGSQHLESLPLRYYYPLNDHSSNLSESYGIESSTEKVTGGKNKRKKTRKQVKGGGTIDDFFNASVLDQPAGNLNNEHSPLLV